MNIVRIISITALTTLLSFTTSFSQSNEAPSWTVSLNFGAGNWDYYNQIIKTDSTITLKPNSQQNARGLSYGMVIKRAIDPEWTVDLSYSVASEVDFFSQRSPSQSMQRASIELSHSKWWKYGYLSGGLGLGGAVISGPGDQVIEPADCADQTICFEADLYNTVYDYLPSIAFNTDIGLRYGYLGIGIRNNSMIMTEGFVQFTYLHADVMF